MNSNRETSHTLPSDTIGIPDDRETTTPTAYPSPPNSPLRTKSDLLVAVKDFGKEGSSAAASLAGTNSRNKTVQVEASALKVSFGVDGWRCGGLTLDEKPCKRPIAENRRDDIDIHIQSMTAFNQSSPQLQANLEKLVDLVHCFQHRRGYAKQIRLDQWTAVFPSGPDLASHSTSVKRKIELSFGRLTPQCIGTTREKQRCRKRIGGLNVQHCTETIKEISKAEVCLNEDSLDCALQVLEAYMFCHLHTKQTSSERLTSWKDRIKDICKMGCWVPGHLKESNAIEGSERHDSTRASPLTRNVSTKPKDILSTKKSNRKMPPSPFTDSIKGPVVHCPDRYDTTPFDIVERSIQPDDHKASYNEIRKQMKRKLDDDDLKKGYLYAYEVEGNKGFVKIGYTIHPIERRHKEWLFDCNRQPIPLFPIPADKATRVPKARRVEALCHAELRHRRIIIYCYSCLKTHQEWFEVSPTEAIAVIEKWTAWMRKEPYTPDHSLQEEEARQTSDMDQYMNDLFTQTN